jgi:hypothetical protein
MGAIIWLLSVVLAIVGVLKLLGGDLMLGIILLVLAAMVGPGGYSIFRGRSTV